MVGSRGPASARHGQRQVSPAPTGSDSCAAQTVGTWPGLPARSPSSAAAPVTSPTQRGNDQVGVFSWRWPDQAAAAHVAVDAGHLQRDHQGRRHELRVATRTQDRRLGRGRQVWSDLLSDVQSGHGNRAHLRLRAGEQGHRLESRPPCSMSGIAVYKTVVNTGVAGAPTEDGTCYVFALLPSPPPCRAPIPTAPSTATPGIPWVSYFHRRATPCTGSSGVLRGSPRAIGCGRDPAGQRQDRLPARPPGHAGHRPVARYDPEGSAAAVLVSLLNAGPRHHRKSPDWGRPRPAPLHSVPGRKYLLPGVTCTPELPAQHPDATRVKTPRSSTPWPRPPHSTSSPPDPRSRPRSIAAQAEGKPIGEIRIPTISIDQVLVEGTNTQDLRQGPGHYIGTPLPGDVGNAAIAGHRTTYGHPFYNLNQVKRCATPSSLRPNRASSSTP